MTRVYVKIWLRQQVKSGWLAFYLKTPRRFQAAFWVLLFFFLGIISAARYAAEERLHVEAEPEQFINVTSPAPTGNVAAQVHGGRRLVGKPNCFRRPIRPVHLSPRRFSRL
jgi:hypothetical protein